MQQQYFEYKSLKKKFIFSLKDGINENEIPCKKQHASFYYLVLILLYENGYYQRNNF